MEYLRSTKGGVQLVLNEFMYYKGESKGSKVSWRCIDYQRVKCKALCQTVNGRLTRTAGTHEHGPHTETIQKRRQRQDALSWGAHGVQAPPMAPMGLTPMGMASMGMGMQQQPPQLPPDESTAHGWHV